MRIAAQCLKGGRGGGAVLTGGEWGGGGQGRGYVVVVRREKFNAAGRHPALGGPRAASKGDLSTTSFDGVALTSSLPHPPLLSTPFVQYDADWISGKEGVSMATHGDYVRAMSADLLLIMQGRCEAAAAARMMAATEGLQAEVIAHAAFAHRRARAFLGRQGLLDQVTKRATPGRGRLTVVHGVSGSGKTSVVCKAAEMAHEKDPRRTVVIRMCGTSPASSTVLGVLNSVCDQIEQVQRRFADEEKARAKATAAAEKAKSGERKAKAGGEDAKAADSDDEAHEGEGREGMMARLMAKQGGDGSDDENEDGDDGEGGEGKGHGGGQQEASPDDLPAQAARFLSLLEEATEVGRGAFFCGGALLPLSA